MGMTYIAVCDCGWKSEPQPTGAKAVKAGKTHVNDTAHYEENAVPLWDLFNKEQK